MTQSDPFIRVVNSQAYGARGNGGSDDTQAIIDAISSVPRTGGSLYFPSGHYCISQPIDIVRPGFNNLRLIGEGGAMSYMNWPNAPAVLFEWVGGYRPNDAMLRVLSPNIGDDYARGYGIEDIALECNDKIDFGVQVRSGWYHKFSRVPIRNAHSFGWYLNCSEDLPITSIAHCRWQDCVVDNTPDVVANGSGWHLLGNVAATGDVTMCLFDNCRASATGTGVGWWLEEADANHFTGCRVYRNSGTTPGIWIHGSHYTGDNMFFALSAGSGGFVQDSMSDLNATTFIYGYAQGNGEPDPVCVSGKLIKI